MWERPARKSHGRGRRSFRHFLWRRENPELGKVVKQNNSRDVDERYQDPPAYFPNANDPLLHTFAALACSSFPLERSSPLLSPLLYQLLLFLISLCDLWLLVFS